MRKSITYYFGNVLMFLAIVVFAFIYFPVFKIYFFPPAENLAVKQTSYYIEIPKIKALSPVIPNVNPFNEKEYLAALKKGVAQAKATANPGQAGTTFLFAHSTDYPWHITEYNAVFFKLGELQNNDQIIIFRNGKSYKYKVVGEKTVSPDQVQYLKANKNYQLVLQTCTPPGTSWYRLLVFAKLV